METRKMLTFMWLLPPPPSIKGGKKRNENVEFATVTTWSSCDIYLPKCLPKCGEYELLLCM
jgi:hypothetical protein